MYHHISLADHTILGGPGPLPYLIANWPDETVADLTGKVDGSFGFDGTGFWPDVISTPSYDATARTPDGTYAYTVNASAKTVTGVANLRNLTGAELAAALAVAQAAQIATLTTACKAQIVGGYTSSALGSPHVYPSQDTSDHPDQTNMLGSVLGSLLPGIPSNWTTPFWCADSTNAWAFVSHTAAQIQQAGADGKANVAGCQTRLATLSAQVMAATTVTAVNAINW